MKGMLFLVLVLALWANVPASADETSTVPYLKDVQ